MQSVKFKLWKLKTKKFTTTEYRSLNYRILGPYIGLCPNRCGLVGIPVLTHFVSSELSTLELLSHLPQFKNHKALEILMLSPFPNLNYFFQ